MADHTARQRRPSSPLIGRVDQLRTVRDTLERRPAVVYLEGEEGVGKSRLVREALRMSPSNEADALLSTCLPLREPFPFGPVLEVLRSAVDRLPAGRQLNPVVGALRPLLPEVGARLPPALDALGDLRAEQHRVFRAARELLASAGAVIVVIEDLHWADDATRELIRFLVSQPPPQLALLLAYRHEDLPVPELPLGGASSHPESVATVTVRLAPLSLEDVRTLAGAIRGTDVGSDFAAALYERTAGIPLVLEEVLYGCEDRDSHLRPEDSRTLEHQAVPSILQEAMAERLLRLPQQARDAVHAAAVLRVPATPEQLAAMTELSERRTRTALTRALRGSVLHETEPGRYGFRHTLAQRAVYDVLTGPEREDFHRRAVRVLESGPQPLPLLHLAYHCREGHLQRKWVAYAEQLADHALIVQDSRVAVETLQEVLASPELSSSERVRISVKLGHAAVNALSYGKAAELLQEVLADEQLPLETRGEIRLCLGLLLTNQAGRITRGRAELERSVTELESRPALAARAMSALGLSSMAEHPQDRLYWLQRAEQAAAQGNDRAVQIAVQANRIPMLADIGDPAAWEEMQRLPADTPVAAERRQVARAYCNAADGALRLGYYDRAQRYLDTGLSLARQCGDAYMASIARGTTLQLDWALGRWTGLADRLTALLDEMSGLYVVTSDCLLMLGRLAIARGEWEEAARCLRDARPQSPGDRPIPETLTAFAAMTRLQLAQGQRGEAIGEIDAALAHIRSGPWLWATEIIPVAVRALTLADRAGDARCLLENFASATTGRDAPLAQAMLDTARAVLAESEGRLSAAAADFLTARRRFDELPRPYDAAQAAEGAGRCLLAVARPDRPASDAADEAAGAESGAALLTAAAEAFADLGATWDASRSRQTLRAHGLVLPQRRGRQGYGSRLSPRERDVARLAALGKTNREIAEVLFLSPRTVEQHVARVLHKLGLDSRESLGSVPELSDGAH